LFSSTDSGHTWQKLPDLPAIPGPEAQLVTLTTNDFWLLSQGTAFGANGPASPAPTLAVTHDGGKSWQNLSNPCTEKGWIEARLAANPQQLWLLCASVPGAGNQLKFLYRSNDGGKNWQEVVHKMGTYGYLNSLAVSGPGKLWVALNRGTLITSDDGGLAWKPAIPYEQADPLDAGVGPVVFIDATHGWLAAGQGRIFLTTDGGATWAPFDLN
jgi:photosystem II stability/assembly factor-like uncharacterized protein